MHYLTAGHPSSARSVFKTVQTPIEHWIIAGVLLIPIQEISIIAMIFDLSL
jgi:hypothetical protein